MTVLLIGNILKISAEVKFPYFIYQGMWSPVVITCLLDYISDLTEMQILISKVTAASSLSASLRPASTLHVWNIVLYDMLCQTVYSSVQQKQRRPTPPAEVIPDIYKVIPNPE